MSRLPHKDILELHALALDYGLERLPLLSGLEHGFTAAIPLALSPVQQLLTDLHHLNCAGQLADGSNPLSIWLLNARQLTAHRCDPAIFQRYLSALSHSAKSSDFLATNTQDARSGMLLKTSDPILVHLHPGFQQALETILDSWNKAQRSWTFVPTRPRPHAERALLGSGEISDDAAFVVAADIRQDAGHPDSAGIIAFTDKRLYSELYSELFISGNRADESPPRVSILSLQLLRSACNSIGGPPIFFRAVLSNILFSVATYRGRENHGDTRGCVMDFCDDISDIAVGLVNGPRFCKLCAATLAQSGSSDLVLLADITREIPDLPSIEESVSARMTGRGNT